MKHGDMNEGLRLIFQGIDRLTKAFPNRKFTIDGRLVGDVGEVIAELEDGPHAGCDFAAHARRDHGRWS